MEGQDSWLGRPWVSTVAEDSRPKVEAMLRDVAAKALPRWRHINQGSLRGGSVPILFCHRAGRRWRPGGGLRAGPAALVPAAAAAGRGAAVDRPGLRPAPQRRNPLPHAVPAMDRAGADPRQRHAEGAGGESRRRGTARPWRPARAGPRLPRHVRRQGPPAGRPAAGRRPHQRPPRRGSRLAAGRRPGGADLGHPVPPGKRQPGAWCG